MKKILLSLLATLLVSITGTAQAQEYFADGYTFTYGVVSEADAQKEVNKDISAAADVFAFASDQTAILVNAGALYRVTKNKDQIVAENSEASISAASING